MKTQHYLAGAVALAMTLCTGAAQAAGTLIVAGDEWLLTDSAYGATYETGTRAYVNNIAATFGAGTNYLVLTGNTTAGVYGALGQFSAQLQGLGKTVNYASNISGGLSGYDAVFHIGQLMSGGDRDVLDDYVASGGNLYLSLGSGWYSDAQNEANFWNGFLSGYGLVAGTTWFSAPYVLNAVVTEGPTDVTNLLWGYGQSIEPIANTGAVSYVRGTPLYGPENVGLVGASRPLIDVLAPAVPEPASWALMIAGFGLAGAALRRQRLAVSFA